MEKPDITALMRARLRESLIDKVADVDLDRITDELMAFATQEGENLRLRHKIDDYLRNAYNDEGVKAWWKRPRVQLGNQTPEEVFATDPLKVLELARGINA